MKVINLGVADGLPPVDWPADVDPSGMGITAPLNAPSQGPPPWNVYRIETRSAVVVLGTEPGDLTRFGF